jgi:hypothetical protein
MRFNFDLEIFSSFKGMLFPATADPIIRFVSESTKSGDMEIFTILSSASKSV